MKVKVSGYLFLILMFLVGTYANGDLDPTPPASTVRLVFIHHSTGEGWLSIGGLRQALNQNGYYVTDTNYGWGPDGIGDYTDIGNWYNWFLSPERDTYMKALYANNDVTDVIGENTIPNPGGSNTIVMFKSCFPNGQVSGGNADDPPLPKGENNPIWGMGIDDTYTVSNIKGMYRDLLDYFATRQDKLFILITTPPLLRENVEADTASKHRAITLWLVNDWLKDYPYKNVFVFDYYNVLTSNGGNPNKNDLNAGTGNHHRFRNGQIEHVIGLKSNFNAYGEWGDDHPTAAGHQKATGEFLSLLNIAYNRWMQTSTANNLKGDVNNDGKIRVDDAILALQISANLIKPDDYQKLAADMNNDGKVGVDDAIIILRKSINLEAPSKESALAKNQISVMLRDAYGMSGETIVVPLEIDNADIVAGGDICISYSSAVLKAIGVTSDSDTLLVGNVNESGKIRIAFANTSRLSGRTLARIRFKVLRDATSPLTIESAELYNLNVFPINISKANAEFSSYAIPPERSNLLQNFPNPLNPDTWIPYQLKEGSEVKIQIHNVMGYLVRELKLGYKPSGTYVTYDRAAYWDGRNDAGELVSSGVYFYSIQAGKYSLTRKMIIVR